MRIAYVINSVRNTRVARVRMPGFVDEPKQFLAAQHLYVPPSRSEGFCIAVHEAMVAGLPVLASSVGDIGRSVLPSVTGFLVPPEDPAALAGQLHRLLAEPAGLNALGAAGRKHVLALYSRQQFVAAGEAIVNRIAAACP